MGTEPLHVMAKPTGAICNLDCQYCFFLSKEELYPGSDFRMSEQTQRRYLEQLFAASPATGEVVVAYQGGEPTIMGLEFFQRSVDICRQIAGPGQQVVHALQTNGTLLDERWAEFLAGNDFLVGLSIDGPRELHDAYRVDKGGHPTFDRVLRGWQVLVDHGVEWNALVTVNAANAGSPSRVYRFLRDELGARYLQFIPIVEPEAHFQLQPQPPQFQPQTQHGVGAVSARSVTGEQYGWFLVDVFEEWARRDVGEVFVQLFDTTLGHFLGFDQAGVCVHARTCGRAVALEHNGDLYSCDHFVDPQYLLGNIGSQSISELVASAPQVRFGQDKHDRLPGQCLACPVLFACNGGCPKDRIALTETGEPGLNHLCAGYLRFFTHVSDPMRFVAAALRVGRTAAVLKDWYARADAARGRNDPCSCGRLAKWKRCHGVRPLS